MQRSCANATRNPAPPWPQEAPLTACARTSRSGTCHWLPMAWPEPRLLLQGLSAARPCWNLSWDVWHLPASPQGLPRRYPLGAEARSPQETRDATRSPHQESARFPQARGCPPRRRLRPRWTCAAASGGREWWAPPGSLQSASARAEAVAPGLAVNQQASGRRRARRWAHWSSLQPASARAGAALCNQQAPRRRRMPTGGRRRRRGVGALPARARKDAPHPHRASHDRPPLPP